MARPSGAFRLSVRLRLFRPRSGMPMPSGSFGAATVSTSMPRAASAVELDRAAELLDEAADDVEAETRALVATRERAVGLTEHLEDRRVVLRADADAAVADAKNDVLPLDAHVGADEALLGELEGVPDQVPDDHRQLARVGDHGDAGNGVVPLETDGGAARQTRARVADAGPELGQPHGLELHL